MSGNLDELEEISIESEGNTEDDDISGVRGTGEHIHPWGHRTLQSRRNVLLVWHAADVRVSHGVAYAPQAKVLG